MVLFYGIYMVMKAFDTFYFSGYKRDSQTLKARFFYSFDHDVSFTEEIDFSCEGFSVKKDIDEAVMKTVLSHLSIALGISYYKLYPMAKLVVEHGTLDDGQLQFWTNFYTHGLGEYFFKNKISPKNSIQFSSTGEKIPQHMYTLSTDQTMVALGGGKDSLVSTELVKKIGIPFYTSTFGKDYVLHKAVGDTIGTPRLVMKRAMDPLLFKMNEEGYYNGHVPISGVIAFVLVTAAYLYDYRYIVMSNEKSAEEGNTILDGIDINHQWSKSLAFEASFGKYVATYISPDVKYFSLLRGLYEINIAKIFAQYPQYFSLFSSCNNNFKVIENNKTTTDRRCCHCPKCAFVYAIMRPFISDEQTLTIFGKELYEDTSLEQLFRELLGISGIKPFECVGTNEEVILSMRLYYKNIQGKKDIPYVLNIFEHEVLLKMQTSDFERLEKKIFTIYDEKNIPQLFADILSSL